jgi:hypothetical protein
MSGTPSAYALTADPHTILRTADQAYIPDHPGNVDYQAHLDWCAAGGVPDPYVPPPTPAPTVVARRQWYHQASTIGLITQDEALMSNNEIPGSLKKYINKVPNEREFDVNMLLATGVAFDTSTPACQEWITALGWDQQEIDTFWTAAAQVA